MLDPTKKRYPMSEGKGKIPNKMIGGAKLHLESNPIHTREAWRAQTKPCNQQDPGTPKETEPDLPLNVCVSPVEAWASSVLPWGQGLWLQQT